MVLTEKESTAIKDLQSQEEMCVQKYGRYATAAKDPSLRELFSNLKEKEQRHYDSLEQVLTGSTPRTNLNDYSGEEYQPKAVYGPLSNSEDKKEDCYLVTDCIASEKLVSSEYNSNVFVFGSPQIRQLLADIQVEEQNHAEMLYKYKTANGMA